ncbi:hypothetical protein V8E54_003813 [Elaphomyces granulatus]
MLGMVLDLDVPLAAASIKNNAKEVMALLLDRRGDQIQITEDVVKAAAKNGKEITEDAVKTATGNWRYGREVMELLLDQRGDQIRITEAVVKAAASNEGNGRKVMALLLDRRDRTRAPQWRIWHYGRYPWSSDVTDPRKETPYALLVRFHRYNAPDTVQLMTRN